MNLNYLIISLTAMGRAAVVVPNGVLFGDGISARIKEQLVKDFNLHTIVRLPDGIFAPYTSIPTNLLFFDADKATKEIWYYQIKIKDGRKNYTKTNPIQFEEFEDVLKWWNNRTENENAWKVDVSDILATGSYNLDMKNPNQETENLHLEPEELLTNVIEKEMKILNLLNELKAELK